MTETMPGNGHTAADRHPRRRATVLALAGVAVVATAGIAATTLTAPGAEADAPPAAQSVEQAAEQSVGQGAGKGGPDVQDVPRVTVAGATRAAEAALAECQAQDVPFVTVAVVDRNGQVQAMLRGDDAAEHTLEAAQRKAYTAAAFGAPTSELAERVADHGPSIADLPGTMYLAGGVPVKDGDASIAGIGVGGAPDGAVDESCAAAGLETLKGLS
ncbi:hypothetical protein GCM10007368_10980 [Isoptericola cucumis]|uniref:Heme-binding protein n=2 Tax=Isoptericola cucumis TaxID=1776856 RepID=A0ABQ2B2I6_9MICO|nr:heme-binding protein [Isoptericola cucumis]GGI06401.1 hypothetical protein GCM10007368_10980 [Isoptericola cucumis]